VGQSGPVHPASPALRRILLRSFVAINLLAVLLLAVPLAWAIAQTYRAEAVATLEKEATRVLALTAESSLEVLPTPLDPEVEVGIFDASGNLIAGSGPDADSDAVGALGDGVTRVTTEAGQLAVYVPFDREGGAAVTIRAVSPLADVRDRTVRAWAVLIGLVAVSVGVSALVALRRARQLAAPFEQLAGAAHDLRAGGFALRIPATGVAEGDEVARALEAAARSAADRVDSAHALAEDASHQVRTPITAARLALESALAIPGSDLERAARTAVDQLDRASDALGEVLALRRDPSAQAPLGPAQAAVRAAVARWVGVLAATGRGCVLVDDGVTADARVADTVLGQILDILLDNSVKHGTGDVRVAAREIGDWLLVDVTDAGRLTADSDVVFTRGAGRGTGLGLALGQSLAESAGGRLVLSDHEPTRFTLALPIEEMP
jgi:signal transduction histidine kinase